METIRHFGNEVYDFWGSVIEWRSPVTAPYLMFINVVFWVTALYFDEAVQLRILLSIPIAIFSWDILLSPSYNRNIITHVVLWPIQSFWRTSSVCGCLYSFYELQQHELKRACLTAYITVGCLLVNPVWVSYEVNKKIVSATDYCARKISDGAKIAVFKPLQSIFRAVKYLMLLQFMPPAWRVMKSTIFKMLVAAERVWMTINLWLVESLHQIQNWIHFYIIAPIFQRISAIFIWIRYWLLAYWWFDLKQWVKKQVFLPLHRQFNYFCFALVYIFYGRWIPVLGIWIIALIQKLSIFLHRIVVVPIKKYLHARFRELCIWIRQIFHKLAVAIRDSVLWPMCVLVVDACKQMAFMLYSILLKPILEYLYQRYRIIETSVLIHFLGPLCNTIVKNIPEKSPFCDDSDIELADMLPDEITGAQCSENEDSEGSSSINDIISHSSLDGVEHDFASGLIFPTIHASESSDEEFDLEQKSKATSVRKKKRDEVLEFKRAEVSDKDNRKVRKSSYDDDFELLQ